MRFERRRKPHSGVEASSLSDILFFLLLFFLMISTMASPNAIKILLPNANTGTGTPHAKKVNVYIDASGNYFIEHDPITIDAMQAKVAQLVSSEPQSSIVLRADKSATVEEVVKVVDIANQLHIPLVVATEHTK